jgi:N6-L-threonylcarbamoyladenine synthase
MLLAIETSCDETAVCLMDMDSSKPFSERIVFETLSSQIELHRQYGGVVPELASREHIKNLPILLDTALKESSLGTSDITAVAVTQGPGLKGCLLVGLSFAKAFAQALRIPLIPINHLEAHIFSGFLMPEKEQPEYPFLCLLVSGGHTMLVNVESFRNYQIVASTQDDAAGEAFDKGALLLGLPYPGGPEISRCAEQGDENRFSLPIGMPTVDDSFSFSGLKTALARMRDSLGEEIDNKTLSDLCASYQQAIINALLLKSEAALKKLSPRSFLLTGGVAANKKLRLDFEKMLEVRNIPLRAVAPCWCTDNAAMIAALASAIIDDAGDSFQKDSRSELSLGVKPRWPIDELQ